MSKVTVEDYLDSDDETTPISASAQPPKREKEEQGETFIIKKENAGRVSIQKEEPSPLMEESEDFYEKKCSRCKQIFFGDEWTMTKCYYHPGKFSDPGLITNHTDLGWSCCRKQCLNHYDWDGFMELQDPLHMPKFSDLLEGRLKMIGRNYNEILSGKYLAGPKTKPSSTGKQEKQEKQEKQSQSKTEITPLLPNKKDGKQLAALDPHTGKLDAVTYQELNRIKHREDVMNRKTSEETYSFQEKLDMRDNKDFSVFSKDSIGCTIAEHHVLDKRYHKSLGYFKVQDPDAYEQKRKDYRRNVRALDQELIERKLQDKRNLLPEYLLALPRPNSSGSRIPQITGHGEQLLLTHSSARSGVNHNSKSSSHTANRAAQAPRGEWEGWQKVTFSPLNGNSATPSRVSSFGPNQKEYDPELLKKVEEEKQRKREKASQLKIYQSFQMTSKLQEIQNDRFIYNGRQVTDPVYQGCEEELEPEENVHMTPPLKHGINEPIVQSETHSGGVLSEAEDQKGEENNQNEPENTTQNEEEEEEEVPKYFSHIACDSDTLVSLSFKYDVSIEEIRAINKIGKFFPKTQSLVYYKEILVPTYGRKLEQDVIVADSSQKQCQRLAMKMKISVSEARYYLQNSNWDFEQACRAVQNDLAWEKENEGKKTYSIHIPPPKKAPIQKPSFWSKILPSFLIC